MNGRGLIVTEDAEVARVVVVVNKSRSFTIEQPFARAIVGAADIADVLPLSDRSIYVQGKKLGSTNVSLIDAQGRLLGVIDVEVAPDTGSLQQKIRAEGGSRGIRVSSTQGQIVLSGVAADAVAADRAIQVAKSFAGEAAVVNAMTVAPVQQVMLEVRFLEVSRDASRQLGISLFGANRSNTHGFKTGQAAGWPTHAQTPSGIPIFSTVGTLVGSRGQRTVWHFYIPPAEHRQLPGRRGDYRSGREGADSPFGGAQSHRTVRRQSLFHGRWRVPGARAVANLGRVPDHLDRIQEVRRHVEFYADGLVPWRDQPSC